MSSKVKRLSTTERKIIKKYGRLDADKLAKKLKLAMEAVKDPRIERTKFHQLGDILVISVLAVIGGAKGWEDIENYGQSKEDWLTKLLKLEYGIPSADTFRRVFERICPETFERCFQEWVNSLVQNLGMQVIAIDGKTSRGSYDREKGIKALHTVSAWANEQRLVLGQVKVADKSNEITAIPALLELLDLAGCIITIDAMGTQTAIAKKIRQGNAEYVLCLKGNQGKLHQQIKDWFATAMAQDFAGIDVSFSEQVEGGHHRVEKRQVWSVPVSELPPLHGQDNWDGLLTVVMVMRTRHLWNKTTNEVHFYISSLKSDAQLIAHAIRSHWGVENSLHWSLDVTFAEDASRIRSGHSPQNFSLLRRFALNALNRESTLKRSNCQKSARASMNNNYMLTVLDACFPSQSSLLVNQI